MTINLSAFVDNLYYMGVGMLGVFVAVGVIIAATMVLLKAGKGKERA